MTLTLKYYKIKCSNYEIKFLNLFFYYNLQVYQFTNFMNIRSSINFNKADYYC